MVAALEGAARVAKPPLRAMWEDVLAGPGLPPRLAAQRAEALAFAARHPGLGPPDVPIG